MKRIAIALFLVVTTLQAASIPVWLDDAIDQWNQQDGQVTIKFMEIHDSFVWYTVRPTDKGDDLTHHDIRKGLYDTIQATAFERQSDERVTAMKPAKLRKELKCWSSTFINKANTGVNTVLSTRVCQDVDEGYIWYAGIRVLD